MLEMLLGYKRLLCLVSLVVSVLCAIGDDTTPSRSPTLSTDYADVGYCNTPWRRHNNSCYLLMTEKYNFTEANKICSDNGTHLVSITDAAENKFISSLGSSVDDTWIGLYRQTTTSCDELVSCDWVQLDGSHLGYNNWSARRSPSSSRCAILEPSRAWSNSVRCEANLSFICEGEVLYPTTTLETTTTMMTTNIADSSSTKSTIDEVPSLEPIKEDEEVMAIIIGCVVGGLVLVAIVTVVVIVLLKRHRTSRPIDQPVEVKDEDQPPVDKHVRYNPAYEDVETNVTFKPSPGNTDTGAHGMGDNPHNIYSEAIKKKDRPGSEGILVKENTLYGYGK